jgi:hypothetical protein
MVRSISLFGQLLGELSRRDFETLVSRHGAERYAKGFSSWTQLVAMLFSQLAQADSLRDICNGLACCLGKLSHLGINGSPRRSTLSYSNAKRPAKVFEEMFWMTLGRFRHARRLGDHKPFRFKNHLASLDSTTISLCLTLFPWASYRRAKGGVKLHVLLSHDDYLPEYAVITDARQNDIRAARHVPLRPGSIVVMDRGYNDYALFGRWCREGVFFVTRMKDSTAYAVIEKRQVPLNRNILSDEIIELVNIGADRKCPDQLRRVAVWDPKDEREIVLLTNHLGFGATTLADIYRDRWKVELFFKALKQNLKVKSFVGTSENALRIQIWTALLALLILKWLHYLSRAGWSLSNLAALLRLNLFTYRALKAWLDDPYETPPLIPQPVQLALPGLGQPVTS